MRMGARAATCLESKNALCKKKGMGKKIIEKPLKKKLHTSIPPQWARDSRQGVTQSCKAPGVYGRASIKNTRKEKDRE
jgi:hypothetical protein